MTPPLLFQCPNCKAPCKENTTENTKGNTKVKKISCSACQASYPLREGIYQFREDKDTQTWDGYWKRVFLYDDILDLLRKIMNLQLKRYVKRHLPEGSVSLEPGGGSAYVSALLAEEGIQACALDYATAPLKIAQQQLQSKAILIQGDLFNLPFPEEVFDFTFNNSTLEHFKNPLDALREMARVTKKGKYVFVGVPYTYGPLAVYKLKKSSFKGAWDGTTYDTKGLKQLFTDAGLEVVHHRTFFGRCFVGVLGRKKEN